MYLYDTFRTFPKRYQGEIQPKKRCPLNAVDFPGLLGGWICRYLAKELGGDISLTGSNNQVTAKLILPIKH